MNYKLIVMDLDGTLNNDRKEIDFPTLEALMAAQRAGIRLTLASARPLPGLYKDRDALRIQDHGGFLMAYNGGAIVDATTGELLNAHTMNPEDARKVLRALEALPVTPILDDGKVFYVTDKDGYKVDYECRNNRMICLEVPNLAERLDFAPFKLLMSLDPAVIKPVQKDIAALLPEGLTVVQTAAFYLEVIPTAINKGDGLKSICLHLCIDPSQTIAFGDSENDIPMMKAAGLGIAMQNADTEVQSAADRVTLSNNENGIAVALRRIFEENDICG